MVQSASSGNSSCDEFDHQSPVIKVQPDTAPQQTKPASTVSEGHSTLYGSAGGSGS